MSVRVDFGSAWIVSFAGNAAVGVCGLITGTIVARLLGPEGRGVLAEAMLWPALVVSAGALINNQSGAFFWAHSSRGAPRSAVLGASVVLAMVLALLLYPMALAVNSLALRDEPSHGAADLFAVTVPLSLVLGCFIPPFLAEKRFATFWSFRLVHALIYAAAVGILAWRGQLTAYAAVAAAVVATGIQAAVAAAVHHTAFGWRMTWDRSTIRKIASYGARTNLAGLPYHLNVRLDQVVISLLLPAAALGLYVTAFTWASLLSFFVGGLSAVLFSRSASVDSADRVAVAGVFARFRAVAAVVMVVGFGMALAAPVGVILLFGAEFDGAVLSAVILCLAGALLNVNLMLHEVVRGFGHPALGIRAEFAGLACTVALLAVLLPLLGIIGAALASLASYSVVLVVLVVSTSHTLNVPLRELIEPHREDLAPLLAARAAREAAGVA